MRLKFLPLIVSLLFLTGCFPKTEGKVFSVVFHYPNGAKKQYIGRNITRINDEKSTKYGYWEGYYLNEKGEFRSFEFNGKVTISPHLTAILTRDLAEDDLNMERIIEIK